MLIESDVPIPDEPKRGRGRPKGSKNITKGPYGLPVTNNNPFESKKRGRPKGSKNKSKNAENADLLKYSLPKIVLEPIDSRKVEQGVTKELKRRGRPPKWAQKEPKAEGFTIMGALNKGAKLAAIEWEPVSDTPEQKAKLTKQQEESAEWRKMCSCTHSKMAHKTDGNGPCMIQMCKCKEFE